MKAPATGDARIAQSSTRMFAPSCDVDPSEYLDALRLTDAEYEYVRKPSATPDPIPPLGSLE